ncbi:MAG: serine/threonine-protein kinase, partial [Pseudomonadota bacterium]
MHDVHLQHLSPGTLIEHYELKDVLGVGGFGITYKGWDTRLERWVAIKEFLPAELAVRDAASRTVKARTDRAGDYEFALEKFLQEARILAKFDHVNIVRATAFLQANGTGYMVMDYVQGRSLSEYLKSHPGPVPQETLKSWFVPILKGLVEVHKAGFLHRDIKPGNIYLRDGGEPLLIDFGAARQAIGEHSRSVTGIVSAGYAPTEQYSSNASKQGPWSDLYALGATMYRCIAGDDPVDAPSRQNARVEDEPDPLLPAIEVGAGRYDDAVLQMIDHLLQLPIKARPQSAHSVLEALITDTPSGNDSLQGSTALEGTRVVSDEERRAMEAPPAQETASPSRKDGLWLAAALLVTALGAGAYWMLANNGSTVDDAAPPVVVQSTAPVTSTPVSTATTLTRDELLSGSAIVRIDSDPSGATVRLDDVEIGTTPFESKRVKDGTYALSLSTPYTAPYREEVTLRPNRVVSRSIELSTAQGEITVLSDPPGARILIDGSETNRVTPATLEGIDAGERTIRVSLERYEVAEQSVEVVPSRVALIDTPLNPMAYGRLTLDLSPKDAQV